jgi:hypothetical protein
MNQIQGREQVEKLSTNFQIETDTCAHPDGYATHIPSLPVGFQDGAGLELQ